MKRLVLMLMLVMSIVSFSWDKISYRTREGSYVEQPMIMMNTVTSEGIETAPVAITVREVYEDNNCVFQINDLQQYEVYGDVEVAFTFGIFEETVALMMKGKGDWITVSSKDSTESARDVFRLIQLMKTEPKCSMVIKTGNGMIHTAEVDLMGFTKAYNNMYHRR